MSGDLYAPDQLIVANGKEKLPDEFEGPLEKYRPIHLQPRRGFVYCRPDTDFSRCGIVNAKYIYRVDPEGILPQIHDLAWIGDMQMALLKEKYPGKFKRFPDWSEELVQSCCEGYWSGSEPAGEHAEIRGTVAAPAAALVECGDRSQQLRNCRPCPRPQQFGL
jgi:hypothetical protein